MPYSTEFIHVKCLTTNPPFHSLTSLQSSFLEDLLFDVTELPVDIFFSLSELQWGQPGTVNRAQVLESGKCGIKSRPTTCLHDVGQIYLNA